MSAPEVETVVPTLHQTPPSTTAPVPAHAGSQSEAVRLRLTLTEWFPPFEPKRDCCRTFHNGNHVLLMPHNSKSKQSSPQRKDHA